MLDGTPEEVFRHYIELEAVWLAAPQVTYVMHDLKEKGFDVATTLREFKNFYEAEDYHQDYYSKKGSTPYCHFYNKIF